MGNKINKKLYDKQSCCWCEKGKFVQISQCAGSFICKIGKDIRRCATCLDFVPDEMYKILEERGQFKN